MPAMTYFSVRSIMRGAAPLIVIGLAACSSPPDRLYLLSATAPAPAATQRSDILVGVIVRVPDYLDRPYMVVRTSANEIRTNYDTQWGESLGLTASRALTQDLAALAPGPDIEMLPLRDNRRTDYRVQFDIDEFETEADGRSILTGEWIITDATGKKCAGGSVSQTQMTSPDDPAATAAAMSQNLAAAAGEIAAAVRTLKPAGIPPRAR